MGEYIKTDELLRLQHLKDREIQLWKECDEWWHKNVSLILDECETLDEAKKVVAEVSVVHKGYIADLPGLLNIYKAYAYDKFRQKENDDE